MNFGVAQISCIRVYLEMQYNIGQNKLYNIVLLSEWGSRSLDFLSIEVSMPDWAKEASTS